MTVSIQLFRKSAMVQGNKTVTLKGKTALLLGVLAREKRAVERVWLANLLHPNSKSARRNLTVTLVRLQKAIGYDLIEVTTQTVRLLDEKVEVDCWAWERQGKQIRQAIDKDSFELIQQLEHLLQLYQEAFLAKLDLLDNLAAYNWLFAERIRFENEYVTYVEQLLRLYQFHQQEEAALELITTALGHAPTHEPFYIAYMQVKARRGEIFQAARWGEHQRRRLKQDLNHRPSELYDAMLTELRSNDANKQTKRKQIHVRFTPPTTAKMLFGRTELANQLANQSLHHNARLITLLGIGGIGKTMLATEVANIVLPAFRNGVVWLSFADLLTALSPEAAREQIVRRLASALGLEIGQDVVELTQRVVLQIAHYQLLLVLDNFEPVVAGAAFVGHLLQQAARVSILVTSRKRLQLSAEQVVQVQGLPTPQSIDSASVKLFVHRARLKAPHFELDEGNSADVIDICRTLGGHPLAVELAAYWVNLFPPKEILDSLTPADDLLVNPYADASARQQSIDGILNYTWQQLVPNTQTNLLKLSIFQDQFNIAAAQQVCAVTPLHLDTLLQHGLIQPNATGWFSLHPLVRAFVRDKLTPLPLRQTVEQAYITYYLRMLDFEDNLWNNLPIRYAIRDDKWALQEADLFHAWQLAMQCDAYQLLANAIKAFVLYGRIHTRVPVLIRLMQDSYRQLENLIDAKRTVWYDRLRVRLDLLLARHEQHIGVGAELLLSRARDAHTRALAVETQSWQLYAQYALGLSALDARQAEESVAHKQSLFKILTQQHAELPRRIVGMTMLRAGFLAEHSLNDLIPDWEAFLFDHRENALEEAFEVKWMHTSADLLYGVVSRERILGYLEAEVAICQEHDALIDKIYTTHVLGRLMFHYMVDADFQRAREVGDEMFHLFDQMNIINHPMVHFYQVNYGYILAQVGEVEAALQTLTDVLQLPYANAAMFYHAAHITMGNIYFDDARLDEASHSFQKGLRIGRDTRNEQVVVMALLQLARIHRNTLPFELYANMISAAAHSRWLFPSFRPIAQELYTTEIEPHRKPSDPTQLDFDQLTILVERLFAQLSA